MGPKVLLQSEIQGIPLLNRGKVRDIYDLGDRLLIVASDRISALVEGVKIGSGSLADSFIPLGRARPEIEPSAWYSFHPDPERYPRTMHSTRRGLAFLTTMARPSSWDAASFDMPGNPASSTVTK